MVKLYKGIYAAYYCCCMICLLGPIFAGISEFEKGRVLYGILLCLLAFASFLIVGVLFEVLATRKYNKLVNTYTASCDVEAFIRTCEALSPVSRMKAKRTRNLFLLNLADAYLTHGEPDRAEAVLASVMLDAANTKPWNQALFVLYYDAFTRMALMRSQFDAAYDALTKEKAFLDSEGFGAHKASYYDYYSKRKYQLAIATDGATDGAEQYFTELYDRGGVTLTRVSAKYDLGCVYTLQGRTDDARAAYTYAAEHGGNTYPAALARAALNKMVQSAM